MPIEDQETGRKHWQSLAAPIAALPSLPKRQPPLDLRYVAREVLGLVFGFAPDLPKLLDGLAGERLASAEEAFGRMRSLAHGLFFVATMYASSSAAARRLNELIVDGERLQQLGHRWLRLLSDARVISPSVADAILAGRGHEDMAGDLQEMGPLLLPKLRIMEALREEQVEPSMTTSAS